MHYTGLQTNDCTTCGGNLIIISANEVFGDIMVLALPLPLTTLML